jgi:hypothetical protein
MICNGNGVCGSIQYFEAHPGAGNGGGGGRTDPAPPPRVTVGGITLPGTYPHAAAIAAAYKAYLPQYVKDFLSVSVISQPQVQLQALYSMCGASTQLEALCGRKLVNTLFWAWAGLVAKVVGIGGAPGEMDGAEDLADADYDGDVRLAEFNMAAEEADTQVDDAFGDEDCGGMSFTGATRVLLADGKAVPIADLRPGEKVLATNTKTGETRAEAVTAVLVHYDRNLYDLRLDDNGRVAVIRTTANHLFWDATTGRWVMAAALHRGDHLRAPGRSVAMVTG